MLRTLAIDVIYDVCQHKLCVSFAVATVDGDDFKLG
jgi:hypothetical protein